MPKISVIMPVYNGEKYLKEAIQSVLDQTYKDFEFIIIDDGSTDDTEKVINSFSDERIRIYKLNHAGIVKALNKGLEVAQGEYIIRSDADDISLPERFQKLLDYMEENGRVGVCGSWAISMNGKGEEVGKMKYPPIENEEIKKYSLFHNPFIHPSVIFRKKTVDEVGGYRNFKHNEDYELWTRVLKDHEGHNLSEVLLKYRIHPHQTTRKHGLKMKAVGLCVRVLAFVRL